MQIHPLFRLNGISLTRNSLYEVAYSWIKEGKDFERDAGDFLLDWLSPSNFIKVRTSGSTGTPKTIEIKKENMVNSALATGHYFDLKPETTALLCLPITHIAGKMMLIRAMVLGLWITVVEPSSEPLKNDTKNYGFSAMVPMQAQNSLSKLHQIDKLIIGGAPLSGLLRNSLAEQLNFIFETYGMTETITHIAVKKIEKSNDYFETLPGVAIKKDDRECLVIQAPKIVGKTVVTNDLVEIKDENRFKWLGRYDNVINSGGVKLIPEQIEEKLTPIISNRFFVAGVPDEELGEKLVMLVEGECDLVKVELQISQLKGISKYERPKSILNVPRFVETSNGKINRNQTITMVQKS
jgi:O-succinylbenzoic acid--CoA ligase